MRNVKQQATVLSKRGFQSYKEGETIYGRDIEIQNISKSIFNNLHTLLYGQSGVGKTSLLQAGIYPRLRANGFFPVYIRLGLLSYTEDYNKYIIDEIIKEAGRIDSSKGKEVILIRRLLDESSYRNYSLLDFIQGTQFLTEMGEIKIPVLVFDQFEELLTNAYIYEKTLSLIKALYPLIDDSFDLPYPFLSYSNYRIVFCMREDYLYAFEDVVDTFNLYELKNNRIRLKYFTKDQAKEVAIALLTNSSSFSEDDTITVSKCAEQIVKSCNNTDYYEGISTALLSLVCEELSYCELSTIGDINENTIHSIIYNYYDSKMSFISAKTRKVLENNLVTSDGRRASIDMEDYIKQGYVSEQEIQLLANKEHLLSIQKVGNRSRLEFSHDIITKLINIKRITLVTSLKNFFKRAFNYSGTASRKELYVASCVVYFASLSVGILAHILTSKVDSYVDIAHYDKFMSVLMAFLWILLFCYISTFVRRMHAIGKSGWNVLNPFLSLSMPSKPDALVPYYGRVSSVDPFEYFKDYFTTPPIRKVITQRSYVAKYVYFIFFAIILEVLICFLSPLFLQNDSIIEYLKQGTISYYYYDVCLYSFYEYPIADIYSIADIYFMLLIIYFWIAPLVWLVMRLPKMNMKRFWAFIPLVNIILCVYGFWPDSHFSGSREQ